MGEFCSKTFFATEKDADFYIKKLKATSNRSTIPKRAYLCTECLNWHLTSKEKDLDVIDKYKQKIKELGKLINEKNNTINELRKKKNYI
jgi:hypothetical protein